MLCLKKGMVMISIPFAFSVLAVMKHSLLIFILFILVHFLILKITPAFKHCENIGMFVMVAFSSIPINIYIIKVLIDMELIFNSVLFVDILKSVLCYMVLLSVEEVIMGILTRWIWKKQYKIII